MRHSLALFPLSLGAAIALAAPAHAQRQPPPPAPRAFTFADTMGANYAIADSAAGMGTAADFDFLVGLWTFRFQTRRPDGAFNPAFTGHWTAARKRVANGFLEDHWRPDNRTASAENGTWTYRVFNPQRKVWEMEGVGAEAGAWAPGLCWSNGTDRLLIQRYGSSLMRIRYTSITDTSFLWRADRSDDGGKSWTRDWWTMEARRVGR